MEHVSWFAAATVCRGCKRWTALSALACCKQQSSRSAVESCGDRQSCLAVFADIRRHRRGQGQPRKPRAEHQECEPLQALLTDDLSVALMSGTPCHILVLLICTAWESARRISTSTHSRPLVGICTPCHLCLWTLRTRMRIVPTGHHRDVLRRLTGSATPLLIQTEPDVTLIF